MLASLPCDPIYCGRNSVASGMRTMELQRGQTFVDVLLALRQIGYQGALLEENYAFADWFTRGLEHRTAAAVAFGQTPVSYESACVGVAFSNGIREQHLVNQFRSLGAPILLEIDRDEIRE